MAIPAVPAGKIHIIPYGGVGKVGQACVGLRVQQGRDLVVIDYGLDPSEFHHHPANESPKIIPPPGCDLLKEAVAGCEYVRVDITHGHHDHCGAIGGLMEIFKSRRDKDGKLPIHMSSWTTGFLERNQDNLGIQIDRRNAPWHTVRERDRSRENSAVKVGGITHCIFPQNHSIYGSYGVSLHADGRKIVYLSDSKFRGFSNRSDDPDGLGWFSGVLEGIRGVGGIDCLLLDVLNSDLPGFTEKEEDVVRNLEKIILEAPGRVFISMISSNLQRMEETIKMLSRIGRKYALLGRSISGSFDMLQRRLQDADADWPVDYDKADVFLMAGAQGEENSNLWQLLKGKSYGEDGSKVLLVRDSDTFVLSSRVIPGNEEQLRNWVSRAVQQCHRIILHFGEMIKLGLEKIKLVAQKVVEWFVHVSGHGQIEDIALALKILRPQFVVPIHASEDRVDLFKAMCVTRFPDVEIIELQAGQPLEI